MSISTIIAITLYAIGAAGLGAGVYSSARTDFWWSRAKSIGASALFATVWPIVVPIAVVAGLTNYIKTKKG